MVKKAKVKTAAELADASFFGRIPRVVKIGAGLVVMCAWYAVSLPCPIDPADYTLSPADPVEYQDILRKAEPVYRAAVNGANSIISGQTNTHKPSNLLYTGNSDGRLIELDLEYNSAESLLFTGNPHHALPLPCGEYNTEHLCGRPMGIGMHKDNIIVADSYLGLLSINKKTQRKSVISARKAPDNRHPYGSLHSVFVADDGRIFFTDSSYMFRNRDAPLAFLDARPFGRLFQYSPKSKKVTTLAEKLHYPAGVLLSKDGSYLLVAERTAARIIQYHLTGKKKGKTEVWKDRLPMFPEELSFDVDGKVWVCGNKRDWRESWAQTEWVRTFAARTLTPPTIGWLFESGESSVLRLDPSSGKVLNAYTDSSGRNGAITSAFAHGEYVYFGSNKRSVNYIPRMSREKLGL